MKMYLAVINNLDDDETVNEQAVKSAICTDLGIVENIVNVTESPFCENCKEEHCTVSTDGTCEMVRVYLSAKKGIEPIAREE